MKPSLFVFATRIEIPGWRCDQLSESAHAGSDREIAESCQQVLPPYPHDSTHTLLYLQGCVVWEMTVCGIAPPHDGYQGRSPRSCHASATALFTQALGAEQTGLRATNTDARSSSDFWCEIVRLITASWDLQTWSALEATSRHRNTETKSSDTSECEIVRLRSAGQGRHRSTDAQ